MSVFTIEIDKDKVDIDLLLTADPSLPKAVRTLNTSTPFVGVADGQVVGACLVERKEQIYDIIYHVVDVAFQGKGYGRLLLQHVLEDIKAKGGRYIEVGCGNANIPLLSLYQKLGFRILGVWPDYYLMDNRMATIENSIFNRDMVRFRLDLHEIRSSTTGGNLSGLGR